MKKISLSTLYPFIVVTFFSYMLADLFLLNARGRFIPEAAPKLVANNQAQEVAIPPRSTYGPIATRNIFASNGIIPDALVEDGSHKKKRDNEPVPTTLPLNLIGTLVHSNPLKSLASIEKRGANKTLSYSVNRVIEDMATVVKIERFKVIIRNTASGSLEYIEMKQDTKINFGAQAAVAPIVPAGEDIKQVGDNQFQIKRSDLDKHLKDLSSVLMQARAIPVRNPSTGEIECYKMMEIAANSIISQLRLQKGDCIKAVNGSRIDSPAKAMELFQALKGESNINVTVDRNGSNVTNKYTISQ